ncbi:unnamed protein product [Malus baccata var. baccata]
MGEIRTGSLPDFEDGKGLGDIGDDALHGIQDFEVGGLGHLVEDGLGRMDGRQYRLCRGRDKCFVNSLVT